MREEARIRELLSTPDSGRTLKWAYELNSATMMALHVVVISAPDRDYVSRELVPLFDEARQAVEDMEESEDVRYQALVANNMRFRIRHLERYAASNPFETFHRLAVQGAGE